MEGLQIPALKRVILNESEIQIIIISSNPDPWLFVWIRIRIWTVLSKKQKK